ncbi:ATP-binding response regulator [Rubripirellula reticaptiva]|uniref:histidine kinase n=1 Tax=Rubripirellula reticaptiva TaxID=2528013 RepID=A0A5C6ETW6_9BACT|nr:hybrid sensor histidine kinase/response regulator [Rubripirellula reticaptiva]TWU51750.1 Non-motile and phage-resistance protein [Rubripirellula reticaptiva]
MNTKPTRILSIEDDAGDAMLVRRSLTRSPGNYEVHHAMTLNEGLEQFAREPFQVIITDLGLPDSLGLSAITRLSKECHSAAIIALSGSDAEDLYIQAISLGADNYLCKADLPIIHRCVQQSIQRQLHRNEIERLVEAVQSQKSALQQQGQELAEKNAHLKKLCDSSQSFVNNVSHEFRTPLCVVKQYANLIADEVVGPITPEQCRMLRVIEDRVDDLNNMVDDMLDVSRHESGLLAAKRDRCDSNEIVERILAGLRQRAALRGIELKYIPDPTQKTMFGDAEKISRTLINLIVNAIKFSATGDEVTIEVSTCDSNRECRFSVTDCGPGIEPDQQKRIFERFSQVKTGLHQSIDGVGLGLNIAKELVDLNLGCLSLDSKVGAGSTFSFTVPYDDAGEVAKRYFARLLAIEAFGPITIFLISAADEKATDETEREIKLLLNYLVRAPDLLLHPNPSEWTLILRASPAESMEFLARVTSEIESINRNRPQGPMPCIRFHSEGSFDLREAMSMMHQRLDLRHQGPRIPSLRTPQFGDASVIVQGESCVG